MNEWPYSVGAYSPSEVKTFCVEDAFWQKFRLTLKGISTQDKLKRLTQYRNDCLSMTGELARRYQVQIDNYINALKRGGQLSMDLRVQR